MKRNLSKLMGIKVLGCCALVHLVLGMHIAESNAKRVNCTSLETAFEELDHKPKYTYRKARKLLFSKLTPKIEDGEVIAIYTGKRMSARRRKAPHGFNCEHVLPRAWMKRKRKGRQFKWQEADLHNLFPSEIEVNSRRGHLPFGTVQRGKFRIGLDSQIGISPDGEEVIEPRPQMRGDITRALLYMAYRWSIPLRDLQSLSILKTWAKMDPPSQRERKRDELIAGLQGNHNPFVTCPLLVDEAINQLNHPQPFTFRQNKSKSNRNRPNSKFAYTWIKEGKGSSKSYDRTNSLSSRIPVPPSARRIRADEGSFGSWLRGLPLLKRGSPVLLHNGNLKPNQSVHHAVIDIDIGSRDLQQCADAVMRLRAEYLFTRKKQKLKPRIPIKFNYTTGDKVPYQRWAKGERPKVEEYRKKNRKQWRVKWKRSAKKDYSYKQFRRYLDNIFSYAGTASLSRELSRRPIYDIRVGDIYLQGGFPGHAVIVLDLADHPRHGKIMLLAQSYMPAQSPHILKNLNNHELSPWFKVPRQGRLFTPEWTFGATDLYRFRGKDQD